MSTSDNSINLLELAKKRAEELRLEYWRPNEFSGEVLYKADDIHRLLGEATQAFGFSFGQCPDLDWRTKDYGSFGMSHPACSHQALLIGIKPIQKDSCEQLCRDILKNSESFANNTALMTNYILRARALLMEDR